MSPGFGKLLAYLAGIAITLAFALVELNYLSVLETALPDHLYNGVIAESRSDLLVNPDSLRWVVFTQESAEKGTLRIPHWVTGDSYPGGRAQLGWSSLPMWWLKGLASARSAATGEAFPTAIARMAPVSNTYLWVVVSITVGGVCVLGLGWSGAFIVPLMYLVLGPLSYTNRYGLYGMDHHVFIIVLALGLMICLAAPFLRENERGNLWWFVLAAVFCALGMWISAASQTLILVGIFAGFAFVPSAVVRSVNPALWRLFGILSCVLSTALCVFEYGLPLTLDMEINNPLYCAGLLLAGLAFWQVHVFTASGRRRSSINRYAAVGIAVGAIAICAPVVVYRHYIYALSEPCLARWHDLIPECKPTNLMEMFRINWFLFAALGFSLAIIWTEARRGKRSEIVTLAMLVAGVALPFVLLSIGMARFFDFVILCAVVITAVGIGAVGRTGFGVAAAVFSLLVCANAVSNDLVLTRDAVSLKIPKGITYNHLCRRLSESILRLTHGGSGVILSGGEENNMINYFTGYPVLGTGYWDNGEALVGGCRILAYERTLPKFDWEPVHRMIQRANIRYIVIPLNYRYESCYTITGEAMSGDFRNTFAFYLIHKDKKDLEPWLKLEDEPEGCRIFSVKD